MNGAVLVTGATGFVGRALVDALLAAGERVVAVVRTPSAALPAKIEQRCLGPIEAMDGAAWGKALAGCDRIVHGAAIAHIGPGTSDATYDAVNHRPMRRLAEAARLAGIRRLVFLSSIRAQAGATSARIETETSAPQPSDAYGRAKRAAEQALAASGVPFVTLRPCLIVGDEPKGNLNLLLRLARLPVPLPLASLSGRRSLVALADVVAVILRALDDPAMAGGTFILADPEPVSVTDMIGHLRRGLGRAPGLFAVPPGLLGLPLRLIGRADLWERVDGTLVARPEALLRLGFTPARPMPDVLAALAQLARR